MGQSFFSSSVSGEFPPEVVTFAEASTSSLIDEARIVELSRQLIITPLMLRYLKECSLVANLDLEVEMSEEALKEMLVPIILSCGYELNILSAFPGKCQIVFEQLNVWQALGSDKMMLLLIPVLIGRALDEYLPVSDTSTATPDFVIGQLLSNIRDRRGLGLDSLQTHYRQIVLSSIAVFQTMSRQDMSASEYLSKLLMPQKSTDKDVIGDDWRHLLFEAPQSEAPQSEGESGLSYESDDENIRFLETNAAPPDVGANLKRMIAFTISGVSTVSNTLKASISKKLLALLKNLIIEAIHPLMDSPRTSAKWKHTINILKILIPEDSCQGLKFYGEFVLPGLYATQNKRYIYPFLNFIRAKGGDRNAIVPRETKEEYRIRHVFFVRAMRILARSGATLQHVSSRWNGEERTFGIEDFEGFARAMRVKIVTQRQARRANQGRE